MGGERYGVWTQRPCAARALLGTNIHTQVVESIEYGPGACVQQELYSGRERLVRGGAQSFHMEVGGHILDEMVLYGSDSEGPVI